MRFAGAVILVTGGCGFIGSALIRHLLADTAATVVNIDKMTYAASPDAIGRDPPAGRYHFVRADICDGSALRELFEHYQPHYVMHLAAETHVDRSIDASDQFIRTNIIGTYTLLQEALRFWARLPRDARARFRFHHVSTDEVYGSIEGEPCAETAAYAPNSPYSASKASGDHLVRAWGRTYKMPTITTNSSNNYGPYQFPEKLIPHIIIKALASDPLPLYGDGQHVRDWIHVEDHARALTHVLEQGRVGETYNIAARSERKNIDVVTAICRGLDALKQTAGAHHELLIRFVADRPGHDLRYGLDPAKIEGELGWRPKYDFETGLAKTIQWYVDNRSWWQKILDVGYTAQRIGTGKGHD